MLQGRGHGGGGERLRGMPALAVRRNPVSVQRALGLPEFDFGKYFPACGEILSWYDWFLIGLEMRLKTLVSRI